MPQRLACSEDPAIRRLCSLWSTKQREWAATGFDPGFVEGETSRGRGRLREIARALDAERVRSNYLGL